MFGKEKYFEERKEDLPAFSQDCTMAEMFGCRPGGVLPACPEENGNADVCVSFARYLFVCWCNVHTS